MPGESNANFADMQPSLGAEGHPLAREQVLGGVALNVGAAIRRFERSVLGGVPYDEHVPPADKLDTTGWKVAWTERFNPDRTIAIIRPDGSESTIE